MKVLIWFLCILGASIVQVLLKYAGIGGAIPAIIIYCAMFGSARFLCKKYDERKSEKADAIVTNNTTTDTRHSISGNEPPKTYSYGTPLNEMRLERPAQETVYAPVPEEPAETTLLPSIVYCRKCGKKLIEGSDFCSFCGTAVVKE